MKFFIKKNYIILSLLVLLLIEFSLAIFYPQPKNTSWRVQHSSGTFLNKKNGIAKHHYFGKKEKTF